MGHLFYFGSSPRTCDIKLWATNTTWVFNITF